MAEGRDEWEIHTNTRKKKEGNLPALFKKIVYQPSVIESSGRNSFSAYPTQPTALDEAQRLRSEDKIAVVTFVQQIGIKKYNFIVAHPEIYWQDQLQYQWSSCEVIPQGDPCHLYFDLDITTALKRSKGPKMTKTLIDIVCAYFEHWEIQCKRSDVLSLDSTTEDKFSRHLIFRVKGYMFKDNEHAGNFVKIICTDIKQYLSDEMVRPWHKEILKDFEKEDLNELFIGQKTFVDQEVYSKNRLFRIFQSAKYGKQAILQISDDSEYEPSNRSLGTFLDSLISYIPTSNPVTLLECQIDDSNKNSKRQANNQPLSEVALSRYPELNEFIQSSVNSQAGKINGVKRLPNGDLRYWFENHKYCERIHKDHKNNRTYWIADLRKRVIYPWCFDDDCKSYFSKRRPIQIPNNVPQFGP